MTTWEERMTPRPPQEPRLQLLEPAWRLQSPTGRIVACGLYGTDKPGVEVRAGFSEDDVIRTQQCPEIGAARELATSWRDAAIEKGWSEPPREA